MIGGNTLMKSYEHATWIWQECHMLYHWISKILKLNVVNAAFDISFKENWRLIFFIHRRDKKSNTCGQLQIPFKEQFAEDIMFVDEFETDKVRVLISIFANANSIPI